jgi:hypothetical protein
MPQQGEIYYYSDFKFYDGTIGSKLFIVLNNPKPGEPYIVVKTTSQKPRKTPKEFCNPDIKIFYIKGENESFKKDTFVQLHEYYPFTDNDFLQGHFKVFLVHIGCLSNLCIRQLLNCIYKIKEDVPLQYFKLIYG